MRTGLWRERERACWGWHRSFSCKSLMFESPTPVRPTCCCSDVGAERLRCRNTLLKSWWIWGGMGKGRKLCKIKKRKHPQQTGFGKWINHTFWSWRDHLETFRLDNAGVCQANRDTSWLYVSANLIIWLSTPNSQPSPFSLSLSFSSALSLSLSLSLTLSLSLSPLHSRPRF